MTSPIDIEALKALAEKATRERYARIIRQYVRPNIVQAFLPNGQTVGQASLGLGLAGVADAVDTILADQVELVAQRDGLVEAARSVEASLTEVERDHPQWMRPCDTSALCAIRAALSTIQGATA
jgi:hypothetical protein